MEFWLQILQAGQAVATIVGFPVLIVTFYGIRQQAKYTHLAALSQTYQNSALGFNELKMYLVKNPDYVPYFYQGKEVADDDPDFDRLYVMAELWLDLTHDLLEHKNYIPEYQWHVWEKGLRNQYQSSPIMKRVLAENRYWPKKLYELLTGDTPSPTHKRWWVRLWNWIFFRADST